MLTRITSIFEVRALVEGITKEGGGWGRVGLRRAVRYLNF